MKLSLRRSPSAPEQRYGMDWFAQQLAQFNFQGHTYGLPGFTTTYGSEKAEPVSANFAGYAGVLAGNGVVSAIELFRLQTFSEVRFQFQHLRAGRPGDLFGAPELDILEHPFPGGTTGDLLARMILDADLAGNSYTALLGGELVRLRPDWVEIVLAPRVVSMGRDGETATVGYRRAGYFYYEGGPQQGKTPAVFAPDEVAHFAPYPDPLATYRGMSWLTPVIREVQTDNLANRHKQKFFENAATPNIAVSLPKELSPAQFNEFVELMDAAHKGVENAYKTLYTGGGADVTVIGSDLKQIDFKTTQGAGETRLCMAGRVHPVLIGASEALQGSSLNAGNYGSAKRAYADVALRSLWRNAAGSLEVIVRPPTSSRLWYDERDCAFLSEDMKDAADIQATEAQTIRTLVDGGYTPESAVRAVMTGDWKSLEHSGLYSVQLHGTADTESDDPAAPPVDAPVASQEKKEDARGIAEMVQKIYLGVGKVISADEARAVLNRAGAELPAKNPLPAPAVVPDKADTPEPDPQE